MNYFNVSVFSLVAMTSFSPVVAQAEPLSLGVAAIYSQSPYKEGSDRYLPIPLINYENDDFYFRSVQAGYYLWKDPQNQLSLTIFGAPQNFDTDRTYDKQLKKLNNRHMTLLAGVNYQRITD